MTTYRLKQDLENYTHQISICTDGGICNECLTIATLKTPHEEYGWPEGGDISIPLPLVPKFKELLAQWEAAMGEIGMMDQNESSQDPQGGKLTPETCRHEGHSRARVHQISVEHGKENGGECLGIKLWFKPEVDSWPVLSEIMNLVL